MGGIATDAGGNVYMTGNMLGTVRFGSIILSPTTTGSYYRAFVAKLSPTGTWIWAVQANSPTGSVYGTAVAVSRSGSTVYVAGALRGCRII